MNSILTEGIEGAKTLGLHYENTQKNHAGAWIIDTMGLAKTQRTLEASKETTIIILDKFSFSFSHCIWVQYKNFCA